MRRNGAISVVVVVAVVLGALAGVTHAPARAQGALTNAEVVKLVKAGLPESVIIQKIRTSARNFDTSTDGLIALKQQGVPDKVIEAMLAPAAATADVPAPAPPAASADPRIAHLAGTDPRPLKPVLGNMEVKVHPFGGSRQEVVLQDNRAQYRIAQPDPVFLSASADHQWVLVRLKPGKRDRNLPMSKNSGWWSYGGHTFRHGVDPKYAIKLLTEPAPNGAVQIRPAEPLAPGEYGFVAAIRGQLNLNEVFDFGVD